MLVARGIAQNGQTSFAKKKQMNRRKGKMAELLEQKEECLESLFNVMLGYLNVLDIDTGTNHCKVFRALYLDGDKTYEQISEECHLDIRTITRYVRKYDILAEKLMEENSEAKVEIK